MDKNYCIKCFIRIYHRAPDYEVAINYAKKVLISKIGQAEFDSNHWQIEIDTIGT